MEISSYFVLYSILKIYYFGFMSRRSLNPFRSTHEVYNS